MSNGELFGRWNPSQQLRAITAKLPGVNSHVLTVGQEDFPLGYGIPVDFTSISAAVAAIPLFDPEPSDSRNWHNPVEQWTILVTPGYYPETIRFRPFVNVVGLLKEAVIIAGQPHEEGTQVYLCTRSLLSNVTIAIRGKSAPGDFAVRGLDANVYPSDRRYRGDVHFLGLSNVDFAPYPPFPDEGDGRPLGGGLIKFDGRWSTVIFRDVGGNYDAPEGFGIELFGRGQNADCHFINCFFDGLHMGGRLGGGFIHIRDCVETHIRNSLIRVGYLSPDEPSRLPVGSSPISAVKTTQTEYATNVLIEGSSLYGPDPSVLDLGDNTLCYFRHSSSDSRSGNGKFHISKPDGIGDHEL
jgi:hypothetical protein